MIFTAAAAQKKKIKQKSFVDNELQSFIQRSKGLSSIKFEKYEHGTLFLKADTFLLPKGSFSLIYSNSYNLEHLGNRYIFEKQFGEFPTKRLLKILDSIKGRAKGLISFEGEITRDKVFIKTTDTYYKKSSENIIFTKVETDAKYPGGRVAFQKYIQSRINNSIHKPVFKNDSAFFIRAILRKDSLIHETKLFDSTQSEFTDLLQTILKETSGWKPLLAGGRPATKYLQVFIMIRKNGDIEADYY